MRLPALCLLALAAAAESRFEPSENCALCHSRIGEVGQHRLWSESMMSHSALDPYWKARVRLEAGYQPALEDKCLRCHAPAQQYELGRPMKLADLAGIGTDGVTCTVCHQIQPGNFGKPESFTGGFVIGRDARIWGPHADPFAMPMQHHTQYTPAEGKHILEAALCGTCHTVITHPKDGIDFLEQGPFLEWTASAFPAEGRTCQSCHVPVLAEPEYIAHRPPGGPFPPTNPRKPFGRHSFVGANVRGLEMLGHPEAARRTQEFLSANTLALDAAAKRAGGSVELAVTVVNRTGHKLPTAYPSRRLWLEVRAVEEGGKTVFHSGAPDRMPETQPHRDRISSPDEVMIYEVEFQDAAGKATSSLALGAAYVKDNRVLPKGFRADRQVRSYGTDGDASFRPGQDTVVYRFPARGPCKISVSAWYQSIKPSHVRGLPEFEPLYRKHSAPVLVRSAEVAVP